jgi:hypothetical protein
MKFLHKTEVNIIMWKKTFQYNCSFPIDQKMCFNMSFSDIKRRRIIMLVRSIAFRQRLLSVIRSIKQKEKNVIRPIVH